MARLPLSFLQTIFLLMCIFFSISFTALYFEGGGPLLHIAVGILSGFVLFAVLFGGHVLLNRCDLEALQTRTIGFFAGILMGQILLDGLGAIASVDLSKTSLTPFRFLVFGSSVYLGLQIAIRSAKQMRLKIPLAEVKQTDRKKKDILVDTSTLLDPRILDLAATGLLDHALVLPRFAIKELYAQAELGDELSKTKARRSLDTIKKLEQLPHLDLRYSETDYPLCKDPTAQIVHLARTLDAHIIASDMNPLFKADLEGVKVINIHALSNAMKPLTPPGETIAIKVQRYGKEPRQGVGYLEDGTMVVVNGGAEFIGELVKVHVLSVKHTSSGRMIFCNVAEPSRFFDGEDSSELAPSKSCLSI